MKTLRLFITMGVLLFLAACMQNSQELIATQDFGSAEFDFVNGVAKSGASVYVVGYTGGSLDGNNLGDADVIIRKYHEEGDLLWARQFGTYQRDWSLDYVLDSAGNSYILGFTEGALAGSRGQRDCFLRKYNSSGTVLWTRQFGTAQNDYCPGVAVNGSGVYTVGREGFVGYVIRRYSSNGSLLNKINNSTNIYPSTLGLDSLGNLIIVASTPDFPEDRDIKVLKYNTNLDLLWTKTVRTAGDDTPFDLAVDSASNIYLTWTSRNTVDDFAYFRKLDPNGTVLLSRMISPEFTINTDRTEPRGLSVDASNNIYISGSISGAYPGYLPATINQQDIFVLKYSATGQRLWAKQFDGTGNSDFQGSGEGITSSDDVYVVGYTNGNTNLLGNPSHGFSDAFIMRLNKTTGETIWIDQ